MTGNNLFQRTGAEDYPTWLKVLLSGPPKSGKTSTLGTVPHLIILDTEPDANNLESVAHLNVPFVTIRNTQDLRTVQFMLADPTLRKQVAAQYGWDDVEGVAIDTLDSLQKIMKQERMREMHRKEFLRDDWGWLKGEMEQLVNAFTALPMHVFFCVHLKTKEVGKGENAYQQVAVGLEGAISESIAGMVGYSLLTFRQPVLQTDGTTKTEYFIRAEGDETYDFLGTRTAGRLPAVIQPDMAHIYNAVLEGRRIAQAENPTPPPMQPMDVPQVLAQNPGQAQAQQPMLQAPPAGPGFPQQGQQPPPPPEATQPPVQQPGETPRPADDEPVNGAALGHLKKMYDALGLGFPEDKIRALTIGQARNVAGYWRAAQEDHAQGKAPEGSTPPTVMVEILQGMDLMPGEGETKAEPAVPAQAKVDGTIAEVEAYVAPGGQVDLARVQEAYGLEMAKGDKARSSLIKKLESLGAQTQQAQPPAAAPVTETPQEAQQIRCPYFKGELQCEYVSQHQGTIHKNGDFTWDHALNAAPEQVQTPVQTEQPQAAQPAPEQPAPAVTSQPQNVDPQNTEAQVVEQVREQVNGQVIAQGVTPGAPCAQCGKPHDDSDLAQLALTRFGQILCVEHYLAATRAASN